MLKSRLPRSSYSLNKVVLLALLFVIPQVTPFYGASRKGNTLAGIIYFTNNTPGNVETFPVELYTRNQKKRLMTAKANADGTFKLSGVRPGKYLLKFTWPPDRCTLWYRVNVPKDSNKRIRVIMDAACSGHNGIIQDLDEN